MPNEEKREFRITQYPGWIGGRKPALEVELSIMATNQLDALDQYAVKAGFAPYSELVPLNDYLGFDRYGLWGIMGNTTIYAIPVDGKSPRPLDTPMRQIEYEGLVISLSRNTTNGQLIANLNSENVAEWDNDGEGGVYIEVTLDGGTILDHDAPERRGDDLTGPR